MKPWERYTGSGGVTAEPQPEERKPWERYGTAPVAAVEPENVPRGTPDVPQDDPRPRLRSESFQMLNDAGRLSPRMQRDIADSSSSVVGGTLREGKGVLGAVAESLGEAISNPFTKTEATSLNKVFGENWNREVADDLVVARDKDKGNPTLDNFVKYFEGNGITDGREMMSILKDSIAENNWDATSDDGARVLSDGTLRVNPKFVALPDAQEGIKAIQAAPVDDATRQKETERFLAARKLAAASLDRKARDYDADYRKYADEQAANGVTDPEQVFYSWPGLDRNWIEGSWDVVRDTVSQSGRDIYNAVVRGPALALADAMGDQEDVARIGTDIIESGKKGESNRELAAARGQEGAITGTGKEFGTTVLDMLPMFAGAGAGRLIAGGAEAGAARQILGKITQGTSVYGYAGAQGYASLMQTALEAADRKAEMEDRELTPQEIDDTVTRNQGAALANGFQTAILSKILGGGAEKVALEGLAAQGATMTGRDVLAAFRQRYGADGVRAAVLAVKLELKEFVKQAYQAGKVGFKDEALEEGLNQYLEGVLTKAGADPDKSWDQIGQETFKGSWMGGVIGGGLPAAQQTMGKSDPVALAARQLAASAQTDAPAAAQAAAETFDTDEESQETPGTASLDPVLPGDGPSVAPDGTEPEIAPPPVAEGTGGDTPVDPGVPAEVAGIGTPNAPTAEELPAIIDPAPVAEEGQVGPAVEDVREPVALSALEPGTSPDTASPEVAAAPEPGVAPVAAEGTGDPGAAEELSVPDLGNGYGDWIRGVGRRAAPTGGPIEQAALAFEIKDAISKANSAEGVQPWQHPIIAHKIARELLEGGRPDIREAARVRALEDELSAWELGGRFEDQPISVAAVEHFNDKQTSEYRKVKLPGNYVRSGDQYAPASEGPAGPAVEDVPVPNDLTVYSPENLRTTFNLTPEQAAATDALVQSMGLDTSKIRLTRGGTPGSGLPKITSNNGLPRTIPEARGTSERNAKIEGRGESAFETGDDEHGRRSERDVPASSGEEPAGAGPDETRVGRYTVYPVGSRFAIQEGDVPAFGDTLWPSREAAEKEATDMERRDEANAEFRRKQDVKAAEEAAVKAAEDAPLNAYLDAVAKTAMQRGKLGKTLKESAARRSGSKIYTGTRQQVAAAMVKDGWRGKTNEVSALKEKSRRSLNRMDNREQAAWEATRKAAGTKTEYTLFNPATETDFEITKAEYDYAKWLEENPQQESTSAKGKEASSPLSARAIQARIEDGDSVPVDRTTSDTQTFLEAAGYTQQGDLYIPANGDAEPLAQRPDGNDRAAYDDVTGKWMNSEELARRASDPSPQGIKGSFELLPTGEALLRGLTNPDVSTAVHELSHVTRNTLFTRGEGGPVAGITDDDIDAVERWAGAEGGNWSVAAEEKFARGFERYLRDGKAPTKGLQPVFDKIGNWLKSIYASVKGSPIDVQIPPAIRAVFDRLVQRNAETGTTGETSDNQGLQPSLTEENQQSPSPSAPAPETQESPENLTSVKNEATDAELAAHGFDPIAAPAQQALDVSWERALSRLERNPAAGQALVDELNTKPRATDDVEHGMLLKMLADAKVAYGRTQQDLTNAELSGDLAAIEEAHRQNDIARDAVFNIITAAKATGTVWGRAGRFRQLAIDEDYSLVQMEAKFRTEVNAGKSLSKEQAAEVKRMQEEIAKAKQDLEDYKAKEAERMAAAVHAATLEAIKKAKPQVRKKLGSKIEEAKKRLQALGLVNPDADAEFLAQEAFPPEVVEDLATVAAGWLLDGNPNDAQFADRLKRMFGDKAAGQAEAIRTRAREIIDATIEETFNPTTGDTERKPRTPKTRQQIVDDIDTAEGLTGGDVFQLARRHINEGVTGFENVMAAVQADLEPVFPGITLREIHDAYSGYGRTVFPSKEEDLVKLREYRTLARLTSQLEDASKGLSPKRTGMQRDKASERVRTLQKQVRDMMRRMGIKDTSDDQRLKTSLEAVKTRLRNEIEELEVSIRDRAPRPEGSKGVDYDQEARDLKAQRDALKEQYQAIFGKRELTDEDRIRMAVKALEKRIEETGKLIAEGKAKRDRSDKPAVSSPEIEALRAKLGGLNEQRNALRDREKERLERTKKMVRNRIGKLQDRINRGDYEPAKKLPPLIGAKGSELGRLQLAEITAKRQFNEKLYEAQLARRGTAAKAYDGVIEVFNASRSIITSADLSAVLRQGGFIVFGNPRRALKAIPAMFKAGVSADDAQELANEITRSPRFVQSQKAGLFLSEFGETHHFSRMEENFRGKWAKMIGGPGTLAKWAREAGVIPDTKLGRNIEKVTIGGLVSFSERTYTAFLNKLRMDTFEAMANSVSSTGDLTEGEAKVIANFINIATGRGNLERYDKAAEALAAAFFSPKYVASRFQLLAMPMTGFRAGQGASVRTRKAIATEYAKTALGVGAVYALVAISKAMLGDDEDEKVTVETDPRSSDFGKVKIGDTRVDFLFGMLQATVFLSRVWTGEKKRQDGRIVAMRGPDAGFGESTAGTLGTFLRTKLAPIPGTMVNLIDGKDVVGNKVFWETELIGNLMPLSMGDIFSTMKEQGVPAGTALGLLAIFGAGAATYGEDGELNLEQEIAVTLGAPADRYAED